MSNSIEINGHRVESVSPAAPHAGCRGTAICLSCGAWFSDRFDIELISCADLGRAHHHELIRAGADDLLYCRQCPMVAYDLADAATDPDCPLRLLQRTSSR